MQPESKPVLNQQSFDMLRRTLRINVEARRQRRRSGQALPEVLGIKLTNRCNLRCEHCYQWNEAGYHRDMERSEQTRDLDVSVVERLLEETRSVKSRVYLWGGEPLVHRQIGQILALLESDQRETTICTNAHFIDKYLPALCRISSHLELLIALEGFEQQHDAIRGRGSFQKVSRQIDELMRLRAKGNFQGKISIHTVINDGMIGKLYELMEFYENKGIDLVLLCFPWYIAEETSHEMDGFVADNFDWLIKPNGGRHSWDAFKYRINPSNTDALMADLRKINSRVWKTRIRYQPGLDFDEIEAFVSGRAMTARCATTCSVLSTRVDISPIGNVSACKFFGEFLVGNLHKQSLQEIWSSESYKKIRETLGKQLSPACSKCNTLYLQEHSIPLHI